MKLLMMTTKTYTISTLIAVWSARIF